MIEYSKDIILSSNFSLRRNLEGFDFPASMTLEASKEVIEIFRKIYGDKLILLEDLDEDELNQLINSFVLSEDCPNKLSEIGLVIEDDYILTINDRDHLAINIKGFNLDLKSAYKKAYLIEEKLDEILDFAFSQEFGYLTQDGRNAGSGVEVFVKAFLFAMVDDDKAYFGLKQSLLHERIYIDKFLPKYYKRYADDIYILKNIGNYWKDMEEAMDKFEKALDTLVRNERRFRRDYQVLNSIKDEEIEDYINIMENNINLGLDKSLELMSKDIYGLKKYNILGFDTNFTNDELDYLIFNLSKNKYKGNRDEDRYLFLKEYIKER